MVGHACFLRTCMHTGLCHILKMESKNGKRDEDDGVRNEGNVTNCLAVPLSEELVPGIGACSN